MDTQKPNPSASKPATGARAANSDEPEPTSEESVPSDGKDIEGEKMMEELGRKREDKAPGSAAA